MPVLYDDAAPGDEESDANDSSDIAESTEVSDEDSSEDGSSEDEEEEDEDEEMEDAERLSSGSSEATEYDSDVWSEEEDEVELETKEATEAAIMSDFQRSLDLILNDQKDKAKKILKKILKQPPVAKHKTTEFLWENEVVDNSHLNKMGRVFVGTHKNLAIVDEENAVEHYLQVVGIAPRNDEVWFELGQKLVHKGDLDMAIYAFERTGDWRAEEALMSTHFLKKNFKSCLQLVAAREERLGPFKKGDFLKKKIASMSEELREYTQQLFEQKSFEVDEEYERQASSRLSSIQQKIGEAIETALNEKKEEKRKGEEPIVISLTADHTAWDVITVFCDLYDRIEAYSEIHSQRIFIESWECREDRLIVEDTVEGLVDDVIAVEKTVEFVLDSITTKVAPKPVVMNKRIRPKAGKGNNRTRGSREGGGESSCEEDEGRPTSVDTVALKEPCGLEDASLYYLDPRPVRPLREGSSAAPSRMTATPGVMGTEEELLTLIRETLYEERYLTIVKALEISLYSLVTLDCLPSRSSHQSDVVMGAYRRWTRTGRELTSPHQMGVHAYAGLYDDPTAMDYCMRAVHSTFEEENEEKWMRFEQKRDLVRFMWKRMERVGGEEGMKLMRTIVEMMGEEETVSIVGGVISRESMREMVEKKERAGRIRSLKELSGRKKWAEIVSIVESDSNWSSVEDDGELGVRTRVYTRALIRVGREEKAIEIVNRMLSLLLSQPSLPVERISPWVRLLGSIEYRSIEADSKVLPSLGYSLLRLTEYTHLAKDWKLWRVLHQVIKRIEESKPSLLMELFNESIEKDDYDRCDDYDELPFRSLRFLVHAHDRLGMNRLCGQKKGAFLPYCLSEFRSILESESVRETLRWRKLQWLNSNIQAEISQCLYCAFGRYSKKKRSAEDHESGLEMGEENGNRGRRWRGMVECAVALSIPNPLPEHDDRGAAGADLIDLINNRFPSFLRMDDRRKRRVEELKRWVERGPVWKGEKEGEEREEQRMRSLLLEWPHAGIDSKLESAVMYLFAVHYHRQNKQEEARLYAECFLSSMHVHSHGEEITKGAWIILSYAMVERMFKLYDDDLIHELAQHIRPLRVAREVSKKTDASVPFLLAQTLYQAATRIARFFRKLPPSDPRPSLHSTLVEEMREETARLFEGVIETAPSMQEAHQSAWDFQWLAYFYLGKLHLKGERPDVEKALDGLFEAACALHMGGTVYLPKIAVKNQKNLEPVEVHYQAHSAVWKYVTRCPNPSFSTLVRLRSYMDAFGRHGVVRAASASEMYEVEPVISETVSSLSFLASRKEKETDEEWVLNTTLDKVELIEELKGACKEAFKVIVDRFPHRKAYHRLAEIAVREGDLHTAHSIIFKKILPRKKKEEDLFDGIVEFTSTDIDRSDSLSFHITRSLLLGLALSVKIGEGAGSVVAVCSALARTIVNKEESFVLKMDYLRMVRVATRALSLSLSPPSVQWTRAVKIEMVALGKMVKDVHSSVPLVFLREGVMRVMESRGGMERLEGEVAGGERRGGQHRKRKADPPTAQSSIMERLGLAGRPPPNKMKSTSLLPRPAAAAAAAARPLGFNPAASAAANQAALLSVLTQSIHQASRQQPSTSAARPPAAAAAANPAQITDHNRIMQLLIQQAAAQQAVAQQNILKQFLPKK